MDSEANSSWIAALSALAGAAIGSMLTIFGEYMLHRREEKGVSEALLAQVATEVSSNTRIAEERSTATAFTFQPPLPTDAWRVFVGSGLSRRIARNAALMAELNAFYDAVGRANHLAAQAALALQISHTTPDDGVARDFEAQAVSLSHEPFTAVVSAGTFLHASLQEVVRS